MTARALVVASFFWILGACTPDHVRLVEKADREALDQKAQLAKYLYLQVLEKRKERDAVRYRALKGLAMVSAMQLNEYREATAALSRLFEEYSQVSEYQAEIRALRLMASKIWRINLENPERALDALSPMVQAGPFTLEFCEELARVYLANNDYEQASHWFRQSLEMARKVENCEELRSLQLDLLQVYSVQDKCKEVFDLAEMQFPKNCGRDEIGILVEKASCFEMTGEVAKATAIFEEMIRKDPKNLRAHFLLENLKKRQRQKLTR
jgi:tetratricopeptide (TPR) repeat protein